MTARDRIQRRIVPRLLVAVSDIRWPGRLAAALQRLRGGRGHVALYVAYDDASSAAAVLALLPRLARRRVVVDVEAVVRRGIPGDAAVELKRVYAVQDARRLVRRDDLELSRSAPVAAQDTAFLAAWTAAIADPGLRASFCEAAMRRLWLESDGPVVPEQYRDLLPAGVAPEADDGAVLALPRDLYDTPVARIGRSWFFAHERVPAIEHRLDELGWTAA